MLVENFGYNKSGRWNMLQNEWNGNIFYLINVVWKFGKPDKNNDFVFIRWWCAPRLDFIWCLCAVPCTMYLIYMCNCVEINIQSFIQLWSGGNALGYWSPGHRFTAGLCSSWLSSSIINVFKTGWTQFRLTNVHKGYLKQKHFNLCLMPIYSLFPH